MTPDWLKYSNQNAVRNKSLSGGLLDALSFLPEMGIEMEVFSGGQPGVGTSKARVGSTRHDHGNAADVFFHKDGRRLDWANPNDVPIFQSIVQQAKTNGLTGFGAGPGYMQPGSMHIGFGTKAVWGADGKGANAPDWLSKAYHEHPNQHIANTTMTALGKEPQMASPQQAQRRPNNSTQPVALSSQSGPRSTTRYNDEGRELAGGLFGKLFPNMTADRKDRLAIALGGMSMNPNHMLMDAAKDRLSDRRQTRKGTEQGNRTAQWLASQPGGQEYAQAIASGALSAAQALQMWQANAKGQGPVKGVEINGQLVNPYTSEQMGDFRDPEGGGAKDKSIARIMSAYGVDEQTAVGIVDNVLKVSRDPFDQSVIVTNLATGQSYSPQVAQNGGQPDQPAPAITEQALPPVPDASPAFGVEGMIKGGINAISDTAGMGMPFDGVRQTQSDFAVLREGLTSDISSGYDRQPPSWLMKNIQDLTPQAGGFMGPEAAQSKLGALQRSFETELATIQKQMNTRISPQQQRVLSERAGALQSALGKVQNALGQFGGGAGANTTRSGVQWRIEQ